MGKHILMGDNDFKDCICGIWADSGGLVHVCHAESGGGRRCSSAEFHPFLWTSRAAECSFARVFGQNPPAGGEPKTPLDAVMRFSSSADMEKYFKNRDKRLPVERISSVENQYLLANSLRMFSGMKFEDIGRLQLDIEVHSDEGFPQAGRPNDRIIAVGLSGRGGKKILEISEMSDAAEKKLLTDLQREILTRDPDLIEGHNIFKFDLPYISERSKRLGAPMQWGRFGAAVQFRKSRLKIAERTFAYTRCDIPGRTVVDTLILVQLYDISVREMASYSLKESAVHFGISSRENRTYIAGGEIKDVFNSDRKRFRAYLSDDLRETAALADSDKPIQIGQLPTPAQTFITTHFSKHKVALAKMESDMLSKNYEVIFTNGDKVEFDRTGGWTEVKCTRNPVPEAIVPAAIRDYVKTNYPDAEILKIERSKKEYEVKLSNRWEIKFNNRMQVIDIDD